MGFEILEDGETALLYKYDGKVHLKTGPKRLFLVRSKLRRLQRYTAQHDEYLRIKHKDGQIEHRIGPCEEILNTQIYSSISVDKCYCLDANQALIVYKPEGESKYIRKIIKGPGILATEPGEWVHSFSWHGCADDNKTHYVANLNKFRVLNLAPSQLYYNVDEVRTADDALIRVKLMIFYELKDIEKMLNETKDPIADFINCCCSDVVSYTLKMTYLQFIESCHQLNDLENYEKLANRAKMIGFEVSKVVFRGYYASPKLQALHDSSVENRTKLKLEYESELQQQEIQDLNLKNELDRLQSEQELEFQKLKSAHDLEKSKIEASLKLKLSQENEKINREKEIKMTKLAASIDKNSLGRDHLKSLNDFDIGIDPTKYLLATIQRPDKVIQVVNQPAAGAKGAPASTNIHLHE